MLKYKKKDIIVKASQKNNISQYDMKLAFDSVIETMRDMLTEEQSNIRIEIRNFGIFEVKKTKAKPRARNPKTNEEIYVPPHRKIHFKPGKVIDKELKKEWLE